MGDLLVGPLIPIDLTKLFKPCLQSVGGSIRIAGGEESGFRQHVALEERGSLKYLFPTFLN